MKKLSIVDELVDAIEEHGITTQRFLGLAAGSSGSEESIAHVRKVSGIEASRIRLRKAIRRLMTKVTRVARYYDRSGEES